MFKNIVISCNINDIDSFHKSTIHQKSLFVLSVAPEAIAGYMAIGQGSISNQCKTFVMNLKYYSPYIRDIAY